MRVITRIQIDTRMLYFVIKWRLVTCARLISRIYSIVSTFNWNGTGLLVLTQRYFNTANGQKKIVVVVVKINKVPVRKG